MKMNARLVPKDLRPKKERQY